MKGIDDIAQTNSNCIQTQEYNKKKKEKKVATFTKELSMGFFLQLHFVLAAHLILLHYWWPTKRDDPRASETFCKKIKRWSVQRQQKKMQCCVPPVTFRKMTFSENVYIACTCSQQKKYKHKKGILQVAASDQPSTTNQQNVYYKIYKADNSLDGRERRYCTERHIEPSIRKLEVLCIKWCVSPKTLRVYATKTEPLPLSHHITHCVSL